MTQPDLFTHELPPHGASRHSDPETSKEAGLAMTGEKLNRIQWIVLKLFHTWGSMTDEELQGHVFPGGGDSTYRSRRAELVRMGKLVDSGERRKNRGNRNCVVWRLA